VPAIDVDLVDTGKEDVVHHNLRARSQRSFLGGNRV
jgi:hypothetical protein